MANNTDREMRERTHNIDQNNLFKLFWIQVEKIKKKMSVYDKGQLLTPHILKENQNFSKSVV